MYRAIIEELFDNNHKARIRIPSLDKASFDSTKTLTFREASICCSPGVSPNYSVGDVVYVEKEDNSNNQLVILGLLYGSNSSATADIRCDSLTVDVNDNLKYISLTELENIISKLRAELSQGDI